MKIYSIYDKVSEKFVSTTPAYSDQMFIRDNLAHICMDFALKDINAYCIGLFDDDLGIIKPCQPRLVDWNSYKFPTSRMEKEKFLDLEEIEALAKNKRLEFLQMTKDKAKDLEHLLVQYKGKLHKEEAKDKKEQNKKLIKELKEQIRELSLNIYELKEVSKNE